jgi:hypothetical protein
MKKLLQWILVVVLSVSLVMAPACKTETPEQQQQIADLTNQLTAAKIGLQDAFNKAKAGQLTPADLTTIINSTLAKEQAIQKQITDLQSQGIPWFQSLGQALLGTVLPVALTLLAPSLPVVGPALAAGILAAVEKQRGPPTLAINKGIAAAQNIAVAQAAGAIPPPLPAGPFQLQSPRPEAPA